MECEFDVHLLYIYFVHAHRLLLLTNRRIVPMCSFITENWKENLFSQVIRKIEQMEKRDEIDLSKSTHNKGADASTLIKCRNYSLGDKLRSNDDIIHDEVRNMDMISKLQVDDYAFIKRSDSSWTYALLKKRFPVFEPNLERNNGHRYSDFGREEETEILTFSLDPMGQSKKTIERKKWAKCIRCERPQSNWASAA